MGELPHPLWKMLIKVGKITLYQIILKALNIYKVKIYYKKREKNEKNFNNFYNTTCF
jgi:hypothetical protein